MKLSPRLAAQFCALFLVFVPVAVGSQSVDVPPELRAPLAEAMKLRSEGDQNGSSAAFKRLLAVAPNSFTINYEYGRLLAQMKRYRDASEALDSAIRLIDGRDTSDLAVYNTKGFVLLMLNQSDQALDFFRMELGAPKFSSLPAAARMKVHNNAGLAYLQLDRYVEAQQQFEIARALGSSLAMKNLEIIDSIVQTLKASSEDVPGIFAPVVGSAKRDTEIEVRIAAVAAKLGVPSTSLRLFKQGNGIYQIAQGANLSYRKAERLAKEARAKGIEDAFVASTAEWSDESSALKKKDDLASKGR
jgi:tetratricopeptide (TPR) repeat protein